MGEHAAGFFLLPATTRLTAVGSTPAKAFGTPPAYCRHVASGQKIVKRTYGNEKGTFMMTDASPPATIVVVDANPSIINSYISSF